MTARKDALISVTKLSIIRIMADLSCSLDSASKPGAKDREAELTAAICQAVSALAETVKTLDER